MNDQSFRRAVPDDAAIERHLQVLFGYLEGFAPVRLFAEKGTPDRPSNLPFVPIDPRLAATVQRLAVQAATSACGVYVKWPDGGDVNGPVAAPLAAGIPRRPPATDRRPCRDTRSSR